MSRGCMAGACPCPPACSSDMRPTRSRLTTFAAVALVSAALPLAAQEPKATYEFNDSHFHLTNYIQRGTDLRDFLGMIGTRVGHVALFGIPLQQQWSARIDGDNGPTYYLNSD